MQAELKSFMYIDCSLRKKRRVDEWIKLQKMYAIKEINEDQVLLWDYKQTKIYIIRPDFMVDNK